MKNARFITSMKQQLKGEIAQKSPFLMDGKTWDEGGKRVKQPHSHVILPRPLLLPSRPIKAPEGTGS